MHLNHGCVVQLDSTAGTSVFDDSSRTWLEMTINREKLLMGDKLPLFFSSCTDDNPISTYYAALF